VPTIPKIERNIVYIGPVTFSGRLTLDPENTIIDYDECVVPVWWIVAVNDYHFVGDGTDAAVPLPELAFSGSLWLFADTGGSSFGGAFQVPRTARSVAAGNWKYQEVLDERGFVVAIEPREMFDENYMYSVYYRSVHPAPTL
jgi:hypothetical protein